MSKILFIDLDSTLWDTEPLYHEGMMSLFNRYIAPNERADFDWPKDLGDNWWDLFDYALHPERIRYREFYPGAVFAVNAIHDQLGFDIHFCSHNPKPKLMEGPIHEWLRGTFKFDFDLTIFGARNDKIDYMDTHEGSWGIVEDKPATIRKAVRRGYPTFMHVHNYNRSLLEDRQVSDGIYAFNRWVVMPTLMYRAMEDGAYEMVKGG